MKFVLEAGQNILIHSYDTNNIAITGITSEHPDVKSGLIDEWDADNHLGIIRKSILIRTNGSIKIWSPQIVSEFQPDHFQCLAKENAEIILLGTGKKLQFPPVECLGILQQQNLGYEVMDTAAACRTFNVLVAEGRDVILAILMIEAD